MGYMGFGLNKQAYTWRPGKPFGEIRKLYEVELTNKKSKRYTGSRKPTKKEIAEVKNAIRTEIKNRNIKIVVFTLFFIIGTTFLVYNLIDRTDVPINQNENISIYEVIYLNDSKDFARVIYRDNSGRVLRELQRYKGYKNGYDIQRDGNGKIIQIDFFKKNVLINSFVANDTGMVSNHVFNMINSKK
jgi:hypothetical protein